MKRIFCFIICAVSIFVSGCNTTPDVVDPNCASVVDPNRASVIYNVSKGFDADTVGALSREGEVDENQLSFESWEGLYGKYNGLAVLRVEIKSSASYYAVNANGMEGGYTETVARVKEVYSYSQVDLEKYPNGYFSEDTIIRIAELYTVDDTGKIRKPEYTPSVVTSNPMIWKQQDSNPMLVQGREYIVMLNAKPLIGHFYYKLNCFIDGRESESHYTIDGTEPLGASMFAGYTVLNSALSRFYEFSEEAYEASKAIVEAYEAEGKTMKDGPYYHYHGMVVESWERYSLNADAKEPE